MNKAEAQQKKIADLERMKQEQKETLERDFEARIAASISKNSADQSEREAALLK